MDQNQYRAAFQAYIDGRLPKGDYVLPVVAADMVAELREKDPELLSGWLNANAEQFVTVFIGNQERSRRSQQAHDAPRTEFSDAAGRFGSGDLDALSPFAVHLVVDDKNTRRAIGDMTKADHLFVAGEHVKRSNAALLEAALHKAIAKKIPARKTTSDVMTEAEYLELRNSIRTPKTTAA